MYPGNESEKPYIRKVITELKKQNNIKGRTIQVANKGLNISVAKGRISEYGESSKYVIFQTKSGEKIFSAIDEAKINRDIELAGYNLLVTSELFMNDKEIYNTYHRLWAIEQTFRIMKS